MIRCELLGDKGTLLVDPSGPLAAEDCQSSATIVDFSALIQHIRFVHDHHRNIERVAGAFLILPDRGRPARLMIMSGRDARGPANLKKANALAWLEGR